MPAPDAPSAGGPSLIAPRDLTIRSRHALLGWGLVVVSVAAAWGVTTLGSAGAQEAEDPAVDVRRGEQLYTANCSWCHSPDGRGGIVPATGEPAPSVNDVSIAYTRLVLMTGRMPPGSDPFDSRRRGHTLEPDEQDAVLAFMVERYGLDGDVAAPEVGEAAVGLEIYAQNCAQCHGATGAGGVAGAGAYTPRILGYPAQVYADAIRVGPFQMPRFDTEQISDEEIGHLTAFLQEVEAEPGGLLWPGELNPVYASGFAAALMLVVVAMTLLISGRPAMFPGHDEEDEVEQA